MNARQAHCLLESDKLCTQLGRLAIVFRLVPALNVITLTMTVLLRDAADHCIRWIAGNSLSKTVLHCNVSMY